MYFINYKSASIGTINELKVLTLFPGRILAFKILYDFDFQFWKITRNHWGSCYFYRMSIMACCSCLRANSRFPAVVPGILSRAAAAAGCGRSHRSFSYFGVHPIYLNLGKPRNRNRWPCVLCVLLTVEETSSESIELSVEQMVAIAEIANIILKSVNPLRFHRAIYCILTILNLIFRHADPPHQQFGAIKDNDDGHAIGTRWTCFIRR